MLVDKTPELLKELADILENALCLLYLIISPFLVLYESVLDIPQNHWLCGLFWD